MIEGLSKLVFSGMLVVFLAFIMRKNDKRQGVSTASTTESSVEHRAFSFEDLLAILESGSPQEVAALRTTHRTVEHGLLSVGLKLHILSEMPGITALVAELESEHYGGHERPYRHIDAEYCLVLPPVGSASAAIQLIECIERATGECLFHNSDVQIQVCSPHRMNARHAAILTMAFYLGSDVLRPYDLDELKTTFSNNPLHQDLRRGQRITIYDGQGELDKDFEYWSGERARFAIRDKLPFENHRTDVLTCTSPDDIDNVNLVATLLVHAEKQGWWGSLGKSFAAEFEKMITTHLLGHLLDAPWVVTDKKSQDDQVFYLALSELMSYAHEEAGRPVNHGRAYVDHKRVAKPVSILREVNEMLIKYDKRLRNESLALKDGGAS